MMTCTYGKSFAVPLDSLIEKDEYHQNGLNVLFFMIADTGFYQKWATADTPHIVTVVRFKRGQVAVPIIIFGTDGKDDSGNANLTCDLTVIKPDGSIYAHFDSLVVWKDEPAPTMELSWSRTEIWIEQKDPLGLYKVHAIVHDNNKRVEADLNLSFLVEG